MKIVKRRPEMRPYSEILGCTTTTVEVVIRDLKENTEEKVVVKPGRLVFITECEPQNLCIMNATIETLSTIKVYIRPEDDECGTEYSDSE